MFTSCSVVNHVAEALLKSTRVQELTFRNCSNFHPRRNWQNRRMSNFDKWIKIGKYAVFPWSISGIETCVVVKSPDLNVVFDVGYSCKQSLSSKHVFLSHGHMDHISGVPQHAAKRSLFKMGKAKYYTPVHLIDSLTTICKEYAKMAGNIPDLEHINTIPAVVGETIYLPNNYIMKPFPTLHRVESQGYIAYQKQLKKEFQGLTSEVIGAKIKDGVEINDFVPEVAYTGDTLFELFQKPPIEDLLKVKLLITEATYIEEEENSKNMVELARNYGHIHLKEIISNAELFKDVESIVLIHFSDRYSASAIQKLVLEMLPESLVHKVHVATIAKENY